MAVLTCTQESGRAFTADEDHREHTENWVIVCDVDTHAPATVFKLAARVGPHPLPKKYDKHPADSAARCISVSVNQDQDARHVFHATAQYNTKIKQAEETQYKDNPMLRPTRYRLELMQFERRVDRDIYGNPIQNTVGKPFDPPLIIDDSRQVLVGVRNFSTLGQVVAMQQYYKDAVNLNSFYGASPRQAKVVSITAGDIQSENNISFYEVAIRVAFKGNGETWQERVLNQGMSRFTEPYDRKNGAVAWSETCRDENGEPITSPVKLRYDGTLLGAGEPAVFLPARIYPERDFRGLGI